MRYLSYSLILGLILLGVEAMIGVLLTVKTLLHFGDLIALTSVCLVWFGVAYFIWYQITPKLVGGNHQYDQWYEALGFTVWHGVTTFGLWAIRLYTRFFLPGGYFHNLGIGGVGDSLIDLFIISMLTGGVLLLGQNLNWWHLRSRK